LGETEMKVGSEVVTMGTFAGMLEDRAYVPMGVLTEALGCKLSVSDWSFPVSCTIKITTPRK
jgi:hypothetical protein